MSAPGGPPRWSPPKLRTRRLLLRPVRIGDEARIFAYAADPEVARFTLWEPHGSLEDSRKFITEYAFGNYGQEVPDPFALELREGPEGLVGTAGCAWSSRRHSTMELGFALARSAWGRGLGTEAAWAVVSFAFSIYRPERVQARCHVENRASSRVLAKVGMSFEGCLRSAVFKAGHAWDVEMHSLLRRHWQAFVGQAPEGPPGRPLP